MGLDFLIGFIFHMNGECSVFSDTISHPALISRDVLSRIKETVYIRNFCTILCFFQLCRHCFCIHAGCLPASATQRHSTSFVIVCRCPPEIRFWDGYNKFFLFYLIRGQSATFFCKKHFYIPCSHTDVHKSINQFKIFCFSDYFFRSFLFSYILAKGKLISGFRPCSIFFGK